MSQGSHSTVFTIGHSLHPAESFADLLRRHDIEVVLDVRSTPGSSRAPQFGQEHLRQYLGRVGITYSYAGRALGGRPSDPSLYESGRVSYRRMAQSAVFGRAIRRIVAAARTHRVAIMCAEADPIECHRFLLIGRVLHERLIDVRHILATAAIETHAEGEMRLLEAVGLAQQSLFSDTASARGEAYALQEAKVAFAPTSSATR